MNIPAEKDRTDKITTQPLLDFWFISIKKLEHTDIPKPIPIVVNNLNRTNCHKLRAAADRNPNTTINNYPKIMIVLRP